MLGSGVSKTQCHAGLCGLTKMRLTLGCMLPARCSSYLLTLVPDTGTNLIMSYWPATTDESKANDFAGVSKASAPCRCLADACLLSQCGISDSMLPLAGPQLTSPHLTLACRSAPAPCLSLAARWWALTLAPQTAQQALTTVQQWTAAALGERLLVQFGLLAPAGKRWPGAGELLGRAVHCWKCNLCYFSRCVQPGWQHMRARVDHAHCVQRRCVRGQQAGRVQASAMCCSW